MGLIKGLLFWGYLDEEGVVHVKRYTTDRAIANMERMPWCKGIFDPFEAFDFSEAQRKCIQRFNEDKH
jgi:hypothetical protein